MSEHDTRAVVMYYDIKAGSRILHYGILYEVTKTTHEVYGFSDRFTWHLKEVE